MALVTIITPSYNSSIFILKTLKSVTSQSFDNWEMIIVDDCSSDNSVEVIQSFADQDPRIKLIQLAENSGAAVARNTAIEAAKGRYIAFLDSDDAWSPDKLAKQLAFMQANDYPFTFAAYDKVDEAGKVFGHVGVPDKVTYSDLLKSCSIGCLTAMYDTEFFGKVYMPLIRKRQDLGLWLKLLKKTKYAYGLNETLGFYKVRKDSISANKKSAALFTWRLYRDIEKLSLPKASYYFSHYAVRGLLRTKYPGVARFLGILK
ncbi:glycosyltransferase family 2 protein [Aliidiomarina quisquiliarum]|uniref:glycosyltransferase family 2 protein n=1 Tax=Aliidiomarina quisquiliarum TaxID=2938947 RepID=UPI00208F6801|nr:glycosyltransferase family 2 protein [Aliidiomarina quisquiliarum]MCO4322416.1 glycosyltransferase [Aliidiomarina quisquiliarum]